MGRIAEALKRAQQERATKLEQESRAVESAAKTSPFGQKNTSSSPNEPSVPRQFLLGVEPLAAATIDHAVVALHEPTCAMAEKYRSLRTRLITSNPTGGSRTFAITSSLPREGKTITAANLAFSLGELKHLRIALVDVDLRGRGLSKLMGTTDRPGLCEVLRGEKSLSEVCVPVARENLYFVPVGDVGKSAASDLLVGARASSVFRELQERFHYTIADTPPATTADIGLVAPLCHCVLVVARMHATPEPVLRRCIQMLQSNQVNVAGCVLTGCDEEEVYAG